MTRAECEKQIIDLLVQIRKVYDEYKPGNNGLCLAAGCCCWAFNRYWKGGEDADLPIDVTLFPDGTLKTLGKYITPDEPETKSAETNEEKTTEDHGDVHDDG